MFDQDSVRRYIVEKLGSIRAETDWQKYNKNKSQNESQIPSDEDSNLIDNKNDANKPQNPNKYN